MSREGTCFQCSPTVAGFLSPPLPVRDFTSTLRKPLPFTVYKRRRGGGGAGSEGLQSVTGWPHQIPKGQNPAGAGGGVVQLSRDRFLGYRIVGFAPQWTVSGLPHVVLGTAA